MAQDLANRIHVDVTATVAGEKESDRARASVGRNDQRSGIASLSKETDHPLHNDLVNEGRRTRGAVALVGVFYGIVSGSVEPNFSYNSVRKAGCGTHLLHWQIHHRSCDFVA